jgi:3-phenylpropionate/trans-cinnamate dioxygenase ferredoxin subunit
MADTTFQPTLSLDSVAVGRMRSCKVGQREIVVCHTKEGVFALDNVCTHAFARMSEGSLKGMRIICPMHGASFDIRSGKVLGGPAFMPIEAFETRVVNGVVEVAMPAEAAPK